MNYRVVEQLSRTAVVPKSPATWDYDRAKRWLTRWQNTYPSRVFHLEFLTSHRRWWKEKPEKLF